MFHTYNIQHLPFRCFYLLFSVLFLSGCSQDFSNFFGTLNGDTLYQPVATPASNSNSPTSSKPAEIQLKPKIITHPKSITVYEHQPLKLSVEAQSSSVIHYQWYKNNGMIAGANQATYHVAKSRSSDQGFYHVVLKTGQTEVRSLTARVSYRTPPSNLNIEAPTDSLQIHRQPAAQTVTEGRPFSLSVSAQSDSTLSYQWYRDDSPVFGAISPTYSVLSASKSDQGRYSVQLRNANTHVRSSTALITVIEPETAAVELTWDTPRMREDGSPLEPSEIQAYIIQYGYQYDLPEQSIKVEHQTSNRFILREINPGILYLRIATVDASGYQGAFSETISVFIN